MRNLNSTSRSSLSRYLIAILAFFVLIGTYPVNVGAEIPHENFELVGSELDLLIDILSTSINASEMALVALYHEHLAWAYENLSFMRDLLSPAEQLLEDIEDVAGSYANLSMLLPPFTVLSYRENSFLQMETDLIAQRDFLISLSGYTNLTDEETIAALNAINRADSLIVTMNNSIDLMVVSATEISLLEVDEVRPFEDNDLIELLERLRALLRSIELQLAEIIEGGDIPGGGIPWDKTKPFLTLWIAQTNLYLGNETQGGGYLFHNGSFISDHEIQILMDGDNLTSAVTESVGQYDFNQQIPMNASWLGSHEILASAQIDSDNLSSDPVTIAVMLIPTYLLIEVNKTLLSLDDQLTVNCQLRDALGYPPENGSCNLTVDEMTFQFSTDEQGAYEQVFNTADLGLGIHSIQASYEGVIPYASSSSEIISIIVNIPTTVELNLFATRLARGFYLVGNGTLVANDSEPLIVKKITIFIDGQETVNVTTYANGEFSFTIETYEMTVGTHSIRAVFLYRDNMWRYSEDEQAFTLYVPQPTKKYPFWPYIPGWGGISPPQDFADLFFGKYAYYTWLLIVIVIGISIKTLQIRKMRKEREAKELPEKIEALEPVIEELDIEERERRLEEIALEAKRALEAPSNPNDRIVWYYNQLMKFLRRDRSISIMESMTHWEVARLLGALEYPFGIVERVTMLFERALYSGSALSVADTEVMSEAVDQVKAVDEEKTHAS